MNGYDLRERVAMVTGGGSGIGAAAAAALRAAGAEVMIFDRDVEDSDGAIKGDVTDAGSLAAAVARIVDEHGRLDVLVHSAGIGGPWKPALELSEDEWRQVIEVNATGTFLTLRAAVPAMVERGYGRVVVIASVAGLEGHVGIPAYAASKAAVIALVKSLGRDLAGSGVVVNAVAPAAIATPLAQDLPAETQAQMVAAIPIGRMGTLDEAASMITWLASEDCSFSTGATFNLTGGRYVG